MQTVQPTPNTSPRRVISLLVDNQSGVLARVGQRKQGIDAAMGKVLAHDALAKGVQRADLGFFDALGLAVEDVICGRYLACGE